MREKLNHLYLDSHERILLLHSLVELKNQLIQQGRYTDCEYSCAVTPQVRQTGNRLSGLAGTAYASLLT